MAEIDKLAYRNVAGSQLLKMRAATVKIKTSLDNLNTDIVNALNFLKADDYFTVAQVAEAQLIKDFVDAVKPVTDENQIPIS